MMSKSKLATVRLLVIAAAFAAMATGCGGGGGATGGGVAPTASTLVPPSDIPTSGKPVNPTATINAQSADTLAKMVMAAMDSLVKASVMHGIFSMNDPWPVNNGGTLPCYSNGIQSGDVLWVDADVASNANQLVSAGSKGIATYTSCDSGVVGGALAGSVKLTYISYASPTDFAVNMDAVSLSGGQYSQYSSKPFTFTGAYVRSTHAPYYAVPTGASFGTQRVIGQPVLSISGSSIQFDGNNPQGYLPTPVIVRSNLDANGAWVELHFGKWDVDYSLGKMLPAATCDTVNPCTVTITAASGDQATINVTQAGSAQTMTITPSGGGASVSAPITF